jgi:hypothetical protein
MGEAERGFVQFGRELWVFVRRGPYSAFAIGTPPARPGVLLDLLDQALAEVEAAARTDAALEPAGKADPEPGAAEGSPAPEFGGEESSPPAPPRPDAEDVGPDHEGSAPDQEDEAPDYEDEAPDQDQDVDRVALYREFGNLLQDRSLGDDN